MDPEKLEALLNELESMRHYMAELAIVQQALQKEAEGVSGRYPATGQSDGALKAEREGLAELTELMKSIQAELDKLLLYSLPVN